MSGQILAGMPAQRTFGEQIAVDRSKIGTIEYIEAFDTKIQPAIFSPEPWKGDGFVEIPVYTKVAGVMENVGPLIAFHRNGPITGWDGEGGRG